MTLPPDNVTGLLIRRMASLYHRLNHEIGERPLVLPDSTFFPDPFAADERSVQRLVRRMQLHAGMGDVPVEAQVIGTESAGGNDPNAQCCGGSCHSKSADEESRRADTLDKIESSHSQGSSCSSGSCGSCATTPELDSAGPRLVDLGDRWQIRIPASEVGHNVVLTTNIARSLGLIFLLDTCSEGATIEGSVDVAAEIASAALGFGALLLAGSYLYSKSCGGPKIARVTSLGCGELAILTALFMSRGNHKVRALKRHLGTTQASAFGEALSLLRANPDITDKLASDAGQLVCGNFSIRESGDIWDRLFRSKRSDVSPAYPRDDFDVEKLESLLAAAPRSVSRRQPRQSDAARDELRALVDEALSESAREA